MLKEFTYSCFSPSEVLWKSGITINMFCSDFLKLLPIKSVLVSHEIPPFLFFSFLFGKISLFPFTVHNQVPGHPGKSAIDDCLQSCNIDT